MNDKMSVLIRKTSFMSLKNKKTPVIFVLSGRVLSFLNKKNGFWHLSNKSKLSYHERLLIVIPASCFISSFSFMTLSSVPSTITANCERVAEKPALLLPLFPSLGKSTIAFATPDYPAT